ncbi:serine hydrolase [Erythrobacter sp. YT30]|uniref:serine hydrolase domain-containing protein n=1 Tax=Erythrobacter sp. YT30 TaxID=1735012 RepID=UPI00076C9D5F|nr:serine hydrolase [Erythrobacter sp. YT30]KWV93294.1 serine hydrolase [Erythrobacter sp. YT30]
MKTLTLTAASAALVLSSACAEAQSQQDRLDARYDRALAAGYKALFLCSAIAHAEAAGTTRTPESVHEWELTGIYPALDPIVRDLEYEIVRRPTGQIAHVQVDWAEDMPDRVAAYYGDDTGCSVLPIGAPENTSEPTEGQPLTQLRTRESAVNYPTADGAAADLAAIEADAFSGSTYGDGARTTAIYILKDGQRVSEGYAPGFSENTPQRTWSVAKSIAATFVGAAVQSGEYSVDDPIAINYWRRGGQTDTRNAITIDLALRMASGRYSDTPGNRTDPLYWGGTTVDERATNWPMIAKPGTQYRYANNDTLTAVKAIDGYLQYYPAPELFEKIGMTDTVAETDIRGNYVLSSQVWTTARDLATLGQLYLNDGVLPDGERLLPEGWGEYVSRMSGPQPETGNYGYGAGWWTFKHPDRDVHEGIPDDAFLARGNRGQYLVIVPSRNVVIVRRGEDMVGTRFDIAAFTRDVLSALEE